MQLVFYIFLSLFTTIVIYYKLRNVTSRKILIIITSLIFYAQFSVYYLAALLISIIITYLFGRILSNTHSKKALAFGIAINVLILIIFKYSELIGIKTKFLAYPIGLSFYVFQSISYLVDVYKKKYTGENDLINVCLYISFFPKILAGPIEKANDLLKQFKTIKRFDFVSMLLGSKIILFGFFCKFVLADGLGEIIDTSICNIELTYGAEVFLISLLYSFQIYFDFFGYSILAIGTAKLFNINLSENFNKPYLSLNIKDFWRRWNITLFHWLREYLYIPLGGNKVNLKRHYCNIIVVFAISGIWHGASLNFFLWGIFHAFLFIIDDKLISVKENFITKNYIAKFIHLVLMYFLISILWLIFRIDEMEVLGIAFRKLINLVSWFKYSDTLKINYYTVLLVLITFVLQGLNVFKKYIYQSEKSFAFIVKELIIINTLLLLVLSSSSSGAGFIYFNF